MSECFIYFLFTQFGPHEIQRKSKKKKAALFSLWFFSEATLTSDAPTWTCAVMLLEWQKRKLEVMQLVNSQRAASPSVSLLWDPLSLEVHKSSCLWLWNKPTESINRHLNAENHQTITCASAHLEVLKGNFWFYNAWMYSNEFTVIWPKVDLAAVHCSSFHFINKDLV